MIPYGFNGLLATIYVEDVIQMLRLPYSDIQPRESVSLKCTTEKIMTEHEFIVIQPVDDSNEVDPMQILQLAKRLMICTSCGTMKLVN